ncbi:MAG: aminotransferase class I/II-fold pyridoxal phosphate-dependent enzyme [bacterium]|nr:aminotransferase class I/II-fold pyridoxal phosphate-dependent enzyme [bacterium]
MKLNDFKLERFFAEYEFTAPYLLCTSDCESFSIEELLALEKNAENELKKLWLGYTESTGKPELRMEIAKLYKNISPEEVLVFSGAEEGIFIFMNVLLEKNDHIIVQAPCYQALYEVANGLGCRVTEWFMDGENNWELDIDFLEKNITRDTKAIVVNFPNNPTGYTVSQETFGRIMEIARRHNIFLFSDEVYRFLEYDETDGLPAGCDIYEKGVSLGVMSKSLGLPGLRIGWIAVKDKTLFNKMASFKDYTTICSSAPSEFLAELGLRNKDFLLNRNLGIVKKNLGLLEDFFDKYGHLFDWVKPKAGALIFPRLTFTDDVEGFCIELVNKTGVLLLPGSKYGYGNSHVRVGFGRKNMPEALSKLSKYLN